VTVSFLARLGTADRLARGACAFALRPRERGNRQHPAFRDDRRERRGPELRGKGAEGGKLVFGAEVAPARDEHVRGLGLLAQQRGELRVGGIARELPRIDQHEHRLELHGITMRAAADRVEEILGSREPGRLDPEAVGLLGEHRAERVDEALGRRAAHAAAGDVRQRERGPALEGDRVERGLAEVVHDDRGLLARARVELRANQRGLARAEEAGDDVDGRGHRQPRRLRTASASSMNKGSVRSQPMHLSVMLWP
jgi:hypothetical protein